MISRTLLSAALLCASLAACTGDLTKPIAPIPPVAPPPVASILPNQTSTLVVAGIPEQLTVSLVDEYQRAVLGRLVTWASSDEAVAAVAKVGNCGPGPVAGCYRTSLFGLKDGSATITATADGASASINVRVITTVSSAQGVRVDVKVIEFAPLAYAPLITVTETTSSRSFEVIGLRIAVSGMIGSVLCRGSVPVAAGASAVMFTDVYGDYQLTIGGSNPRTADVAAVTAYLREASGTVDTLTVSGPVVPGPMYPPPSGLAMHQWTCG